MSYIILQVAILAVLNYNIEFANNKTFGIKIISASCRV